MAKSFVAFGDLHIPEHNPTCVDVFLTALEVLKPDVAVSLGDLLDCKAFSTHSPDIGGDTSYEADVACANQILDKVQRFSKQLILVEGNHEYRYSRWVAKERVGKAFGQLGSPQTLLMRGRKNARYIPYADTDGIHSHYRLSKDLVFVHGWSYAENATKRHMEMSQGISVVHGHTHRADHHVIQNVWERGKIEAISAGCLCLRNPVYMAGAPTRWTNGFVVGYCGRHSHTLYFVPIMDNYCVLPGGQEINVKQGR